PGRRRHFARTTRAEARRRRRWVDRLALVERLERGGEFVIVGRRLIRGVLRFLRGVLRRRLGGRLGLTKQREVVERARLGLDKLPTHGWMRSPLGSRVGSIGNRRPPPERGRRPVPARGTRRAAAGVRAS